MKKIFIFTILFVLVFSISITATAQSSYEIPSWVKGIAGFWAEDKISDAEFGEGLSFLIDNDIIQVPKIQELENRIVELEKITPSQNCDDSYLDVCIPPYPPDLDCGEIFFANFRSIGDDPHGFDRDGDGIGCQS